jgi:hypothetical protein
MENLCNICKRVCKARNNDRSITVISCNGYVCDFEQIERSEIQTRLCQ